MKVLALFGAASVVDASFLSETQKVAAGNPIRQVVNILEEMVEKMTSEQEQDSNVFAKLECWCKQNNQEQTQIKEKSEVDFEAAIAAQNKAYASKVALQEKRNERFAKKTETVDALNVKKAKCGEDKRNAGKQANNLKETVNAAKSAVMILTRGQKAFVQANVDNLRKQLTKIVNSSAAQNLNRPEDMILIQGFLDDETTSSKAFLQGAGNTEFTSQAGPVVGMLKAMITDLTNDIEANGVDEVERVKDCEESIANFNTDIESLAKQIEQDDAQIGQYSEEQARQLEASQQADTDRLNAISFLETLTSQCSQSKADYTSRRDSRATEIKACNETIQILDSDEAFKSFQKNSATAVQFLQVDKTVKKGDDSRIMAVWSLDKVSQKNASIYLIQSMIQSAINSKAKAGVFDQIIKKIAEVIKVIKVDLKEQIDMRDNCIEDIDDLKMQFTEANKSKEYEISKSEDAAAKIATFTSEIEDRQETVKELDKEVATKSDDRQEEVKLFLESQQDAKTTVEILTRAVAKMVEIYGKKPGSFVQAPVTEFKATADAPGSAPAGFTNQGKTTKDQENGGEVVTLLRTILEDAEKELATIEESEKDSQDAYDESMRQATHEKKANMNAIASLEKRRAGAATDKQAADANAKALNTETLELLKSLEATEAQCSEVLTHFKAMQAAGKNEIRSLNEAKTVLSGLNK